MTDYSIFSLSHARETKYISRVRADVEFGVMQANGDCVGIGICRITATNALTHPRRCPRAKAFLSASEAGRLEIFFPRNGMLPCTERAFFRSRMFPVPVPIFLAEDIRVALPGLQQIILEAGLYPVQTEASGYRLAF
ncbi:MAG: hypothetical protein RMJ33_11270 [Saprospiraceae bacterium]|nr:hypothetical protein [Saprospiraceae bacterium]MDW8230408.1 hypothetical protein [Saprospiraceae bacterium]